MSSAGTFDEKRKPTDRAFEKAVGRSAAAWRKLRAYLKKYYPFTSELFYDKKEAVWFIRYRKSGKTLCTLIPGENAFTTLVVLGKKEVEKAETLRNQLGRSVRTLFDSTEQLHDGRWLWIKPRIQNDIEDVKTLLQIKRRPRLRGT